MTIKEFFIDTCNKVSQVFKRFPIAVLCCIVLTIALLLPDRTSNPGFYWLVCMGFVLSLSLKIWRESRKQEDKKTDALVLCGTIGAYFAHILISSLFMIYYDDMTVRYSIALSAVGLAIILSLFCLPYFGTKNDIPFWHHVRRIFAAGLISYLFAGVLCGGLELILLAFSFLFDFSTNEEIYIDILVTCGCFIFPVIFMAYLPSKEAIFDESVPEAKNITFKLNHYVIIPLTLIYLGILYLYMAKILIQFDLPRGTLTYLVSAAMAVVLFLILCIYPAKFKEDAIYDKKLIKWLPLLMLPLLVLMSVGILRRISDYGLSIHRIYVLLFNFWSYAICIYLIKTNTKRLIWVPVSFCLVFCAVSILPINVSSFTQYWIHHSVESQLRSAGYTLPINTTDYCKWMSSIDYNEDVRDQIHYLRNRFTSSSTDDLFSFGGRGLDVYGDYNCMYSYFYNPKFACIECLNPKKPEDNTSNTHLEDTRNPFETTQTEETNAPKTRFYTYTRVRLVDSRPISCLNGIRHFSGEWIDTTFENDHIIIHVPYIKEKLSMEDGIEKSTGEEVTYRTTFTFTKSELDNSHFPVFASDTDDKTLLYVGKIIVDPEVNSSQIYGFLCLQ